MLNRENSQNSLEFRKSSKPGRYKELIFSPLYWENDDLFGQSFSENWWSCILYLLFNFTFNWRIVALHILNGFCHTLTWISMGIPMSPPYQLLAQTTQLGCQRALVWVPCIIRWIPTGSLFYIWYCFILLSQVFHPLPHSLWPKVCSVCLYLLYCPEIGSSVPSF